MFWDSAQAVGVVCSVVGACSVLHIVNGGEVRGSIGACAFYWRRRTGFVVRSELRSGHVFADAFLLQQTIFAMLLVGRNKCKDNLTRNVYYGR
jgi:hypothetical protein